MSKPIGEDVSFTVVVRDGKMEIRGNVDPAAVPKFLRVLADSIDAGRSPTRVVQPGNN